MNKFVSAVSLLFIISAPAMADSQDQIITEKTMPGVVSEERTMPITNDASREPTQIQNNQGKYNAAEKEKLKTQEELIQEKFKRQQEQPVVR